MGKRQTAMDLSNRPQLDQQRKGALYFYPLLHTRSLIGYSVRLQVPTMQPKTHVRRESTLTLRRSNYVDLSTMSLVEVELLSAVQWASYIRGSYILV